jgi:apolipoprotein N-acyltransferase
LCSPKYRFSILFLPALFTTTEWIRSFIFTGFPWLSYGYSQTYVSPLSGYLPIIGVHGVTFFMLLSVIVCYKIIVTKQNMSRLLFILIIIIIWFGGFLLKKIKWTHPQGEPISISLIQGNISQDKKWDNAYIKESFNKYLKMIENSSASLIILPETSIPVLQQNIPNQFLERLIQHAKNNNGDILYGVIEKDDEEYFNSAISVGVNGNQKYQKYHLVPFGEFIPFKTIMQYVYENWLDIPFNDISRGSKNQKPLTIDGNKIAINICYEDVFGTEIVKPLPEANILVNLSNDAWYGESIASQQHLQISQARAIETGRMMVRATNTGATAIINTDGKLIKQFPLFKEGSLHGYMQGL